MQGTLRIKHDKWHIELEECIQQYHFSRQKLSTYITQILKMVNSLQNIVRQEIFQSIKPTEIIEVQRSLGGKFGKNGIIEVENPALVVIGQVKSGKSRLLNTLLRKTVLPESFDVCTMRIIRLTYGKNKTMEIFNNKQKISELKYKKLPLAEKYVKLSGELQNDVSELSKLILAHVDSSFLKDGIDLIDTPGLNKNRAMTDVSLNILSEVLPIVIYVIDGNTSIKQTDITNLYELKERYPNIYIIYFVTYLDSEGPNKTANAEGKINLVFKRLQKHNFIPHVLTSWKQCDYLHGNSLSAIIDIYNKKYKLNGGNEEYDYYLKLMSRFEIKLKEILEFNFKQKMIQSSSLVKDYINEVLIKVNATANNFVTKNQEKFDLVEEISRKELKLFKTLTSSVNNSKSQLKCQILEKFKKNTKAILEPIIELQYPEKLNVPSNGIVKDSKLQQQCRQVIMTAMVQGLEDVVKQFVYEEFFQEYEILISHFSSPNRDNSVKSCVKVTQSPYQSILEKKIKNYYKLTVGVNVTKAQSNHNPDMLDFVNVVMNSIKNFLGTLKVPGSDSTNLNVNSKEWKLSKAQEILNEFDHHIIADKVCENLITDLGARHAQFLQKMEEEKKVINSIVMQNILTKDEYTKNNTEFYLLFAKTLSIKTSYEFKEVERKKELATGEQGLVYTVISNGNEFVEKEIKVDGAYSVSDIAQEIYYSSFLSHYRLQQCLGAVINEKQNYILIYYERMKSDLLTYLLSTPESEIDRLKLAIQIAEGVEYLHSEGIIHRDLKLSNVLIDFNNNIHLADYGFCKTEAMLKYSIKGTPIHMAPEAVISNSFYSNKVDVYSFGILMWYLYEGNGRHPNRARNRASRKQFAYSIVIWQQSSDSVGKTLSENSLKCVKDYRPERLENISEDLWNLLERCWQSNPHDRPEMSTVLNELRSFEKNNKI